MTRAYYIKAQTALIQSRSLKNSKRATNRIFTKRELIKTLKRSITCSEPQVFGFCTGLIRSHRTIRSSSNHIRDEVGYRQIGRVDAY